MSKNTLNGALLEEIALEEFGVSGVPPKVRGLARKLAREMGCSSREALPLAYEKINNTASPLTVKKKSKNSLKKISARKKNAEIGRPKFTCLVHGGSPGLGKKS